MPGKKSEWVTKSEELKAALPKGFDARVFRGAKVDGKLDKAKFAKIADEKGMKDKADAVLAYLAHMDSKPASTKKGKAKAKKQVVETCTPKTLLSKKTYNELSASQLEKLIAMLPEIQKARKDKELADAKAELEKAQKKVKDLQGK